MTRLNIVIFSDLTYKLNRMEEKNKYYFAREILFNLKSSNAITSETYWSWFDKLIEDEEQAKNNDDLDIVSNRISPKDIKKYRKQGRMSVSSKVEQIYKLNSERFDEDYCDYDFTLLHDC